MEITVTIDDDLYSKALEFADPGVEKPSDLFREVLEFYVRTQAARRLAALGGASPGMDGIPRRREDQEDQ